MKKFRKLTAIVLALLMMLAYMPVMAEETTYALRGDASIYAPKPGRKASVEYKLVKTVDGVESVVEDAELSISADAPAGVSVSMDKKSIVVNGDTIATGSFIVTATKGSETASKTVKVENFRMFYTFDEFGEGTTIRLGLKNLDLTPYIDGKGNNPGIANSADSKAKKESEGDMYASGTIQLIPEWGVPNWTKASNVITVEFDYCYKYTGQIFLAQTSSGTNLITLSRSDVSGKGRTLYCNSKETDFVYGNNDSTYRTRIEFNCFDRKYNVYIGDVNYGTYDFASGSGYFKSLYLSVGGDNLAVYTGRALVQTPGTISGDAKLFAPPKGVKSALNYVAKDSKGNVLNNVLWSVQGTMPGVTVDNTGKVIMDGSLMTKSGAFTLVAENDTVKAEKEIKVQDFRIYEDFEDQADGADFKMTFENINGTAGPAGLTNTTAKVTAEGENNYVSLSGVKYAGMVWRWNSALAEIKNSSVTSFSFRTKGSGSFQDDGKLSFGFSNGKFVIASNVTDGEQGSGWTDVRCVLDYTDENYPYGKYKVYVDDVLASENVALTDPAAADRKGYISDPAFFMSFDDIAYYSGETIVEDYLTVDGEAYTDGEVLATGNHTVKARVSGALSGTDSRVLVMAHFNGAKLEKVDYLSQSFTDSYEMAARLDGVTGGKVKLFLWDGALKPIEINSFAAEIQ